MIKCMATYGKNYSSFQWRSLSSATNVPIFQSDRLKLGRTTWCWARSETKTGVLKDFSFQALELAVHATQACKFTDWWWKVQLGKCYFTLGLIREAEQQFRSALRYNVPHILYYVPHTWYCTSSSSNMSKDWQFSAVSEINVHGPYYRYTWFFS